MVAHATAGLTFHYSGKISAAKKFFRQAERIQTERQQDHPFLYSVHGFWFFDFLTDEAEVLATSLGEIQGGDRGGAKLAHYCEQLRKRAETVLKWETEKLKWGLLSEAMWHLAMGKTALLETIYLGRDCSSEAEDHINRAVQCTKKAGQQDYLPRILLARAESQRLRENFDAARADLEQALDIASRCSAQVHKADYHLENARLGLAIANRAQARKDIKRAAEIIERTGYHRRDASLRLLRQRLQSA